MKIQFLLSLLLAVVVAIQAKADSSSFHDAWISQGVPPKALDQALIYQSQSTAITNKEWLIIGDYTALSNQERFYVMNLKTGEFTKTFVSHGEGSDDGTGVKAVRFSNINNSLMTSPGFMRIGQAFTSPGYGPAFHLDGLETRNDLVALRMIIMHSASYTTLDFIKANGHPGLSQGCPAIPPAMLSILMHKNIVGSLFYAYTAEDAMD